MTGRRSAVPSRHGSAKARSALVSRNASAATTVSVASSSGSANGGAVEDDASLELGRKLRDWAIEMGFKPEGRYSGRRVASADEFAKLCRGNMAAVWSFVISHAMPPAKVEHIRANLVAARKLAPFPPASLADGDAGAGGGGGVDLLRDAVRAHDAEHRRKELTDRLARARRELAELDATLSSSSPLHRDLAALKLQLQHAELRRRAEREKRNEHERRRMLTTAFVHKAQHNTAEMLEFLKRLTNGLAHPSLPVYNPETGAFDDTAEPLTTDEMFDAQQLMKEVSSSLLLSTPGFGSKSTEMERQCKANVIIQQADGHRIPIGKLIHCLTSLTQQHRTTVDALMQSESASGSAASASATTATANGSSAASDSTAQRQQQICRKTAALLQEQRLRHIQRFLETEAALNSAHQLNAEYNKACEHLSTLLRVNDTNQDRVLSTSAANLIIHAQETMQLLVSESRLAGETASLATLQKLTEQIATAVQTQSAAIKEVEKKHFQIQALEASKIRNQQRLDEIYGENLRRLEDMLQLRAESAQIIEHQLIPAAKTSRPRLTQLRDIVQNELAVFRQTPIEKLWLTPIAIPDPFFPAYIAGTVPLPQTADITSAYIPRHTLDLHRIAYPSPEMFAILCELEFPPYKGAESLLPFIQTLKRLRTDEESRIASSRTEMDKLQSAALRKLNSDDAVKDLSQRVAAANQQQEEWFAKLAKSVGLVKQGIEDCSALSNLVEEWWNQPAQYVTPWITVDGKNLKQWRDQFAALRHRLVEY